MSVDEALIHLASRSPRRRQLLAQVGVPYGTLELDVPEVVQPGEKPADYVLRVARDKATAGIAVRPDQAPVLAADTEVVLGDQIFGKPRDRQDAHRMLSALSGRWHQVISGVVLSDGEQTLHRLQVSEVHLADLDGDAIDAYWDSGEPQGKAGAYAIQGLGGGFVDGLKGSYSSVMGLPLFETLELLRELGVRGFESVAAGLRFGASSLQSAVPA